MDHADDLALALGPAPAVPLASYDGPNFSLKPAWGEAAKGICHVKGIPFAAVSWGYATPELLASQEPDQMFVSVGDITRAIRG